jgi:hypothetical protein
LAIASSQRTLLAMTCKRSAEVDEDVAEDGRQGVGEIDRGVAKQFDRQLFRLTKIG